MNHLRVSVAVPISIQSSNHSKSFLSVQNMTVWFLLNNSGPNVLDARENCTSNVYVWGARVEFNAYFDKIKKYFLILEINFLILKIHFLRLKLHSLILEIQFPILENDFSAARLCQQSSWSLCGVRRPCHNYLRTYWAHSVQISVLASPGPYPHYEKKCIQKVSGFFLFVFVNMGPHGSPNFKTLLIPQITFEYFQPFPEFSSQLSSQKYCFRCLKF